MRSAPALLAAAGLALSAGPACAGETEVARSTAAASVEGRSIELYSIGAGTSTVLVIGSMHGDEPQGRDIVTRLVSDLARSGVAEGRQVLLVPALNPDGLAKRGRLNANGVDINRNLPTKDWGRRCKAGGCSPGPRPASEPETKLLLKLIEEHPPRLIISIHSRRRVVNFDGPAKAYAAGMSARTGYPVRPYIGYETPGSLGTYAGKERGIPVVTLETSGRAGDAVYAETRGAIMWAVSAAP